jgi:D-alanyl-D-alanine carboxypeptidase (penicillin-binding protein 5/6)
MAGYRRWEACGDALNRSEFLMVTRTITVLLIALGLTSSSWSQEIPAADSGRQPADSLDGPPLVTAKAWVIGDGKTGRVLWGSEQDTPRAIASTTKIMTAWIVLSLCEKDKSLLDETVTFSERADKTSGSTSAIQAGEKLAVRDLLYGLLLPSGNDASVALAEHFGRYFLEGSDAEQPGRDECLDAFVGQMNKTAKSLEMARTSYLDPHGLGKNEASAADLLRLTYTAMQNETFRRYVQTQRHTCTVAKPDGQTREANWKNTNVALGIEGFDGVKTGTTNAAGACLVASCHRGGDHLLVVVLGSTSPEGRYVDARNLLRWAWIQRARSR